MIKLHRDWPDVDTASDPYRWPDPVYDLAYALELDSIGEFDMRRAIESIEYIEGYVISYDGKPWEPGRVGGAELDMIVIARLHKDSYLSSGNKCWLVVEAWNDLSGWAGQYRVSSSLVETLDEAKEKLSYYGEKKMKSDDD